MVKGGLETWGANDTRLGELWTGEGLFGELGNREKTDPSLGYKSSLLLLDLVSLNLASLGPLRRSCCLRSPDIVSSSDSDESTSTGSFASESISAHTCKALVLNI